MASRLRQNVGHIFEVFAEVARPEDPQDAAFVLQHYPEDLDDKKILDVEIPKFAFPGETDNSAVDHFSFVLTDEDGKFKFGFCRHAAGSQTCLCIISFLPWFEIFYRLLNNLAEILNRTDSNDVTPLLEALYSHPVPHAEEKVNLLPHITLQAFSFTCPNPDDLPCIPHNRNLTEYYNAVDIHTMMVIFASMLQERRILVISRKLSRLTACVHGSASLLYPLCWQHIYIPVLPPQLLDYCSAPMPYLIGIHSTLFQHIRASELGDAVVLNADDNTISSEYNDLEVLPGEVISLLKKKLKAQNAEKIGTSSLGDGVAKAFLKSNVAIMGGYRQALRFPPGEQITFDEDAFIHSRPPSMQPFLEKVLHTQMFEQFINDRLDKLIAGEGFSDLFDNEVNLEQDKWATQSRYKEWYGNMKKQGKKVRKEGKEKWVEFSSKANPAMKGAMRAVKDKSRKAVKDIRSKLEELRKEDAAQRAALHRNRPATIDSPAIKAQRPPRPPPPDHGDVVGSSQRQPNLRRASYDRARQYKVISMDELDDSGPKTHNRPRSPSSPTPRPMSGISPAHSLLRQSRHSRRMASEDTDIISDMTYQRVSLDLLGDCDIQTMLKKSYSLEDLSATVVEEEEDSEEDSEDVVSYTSLADEEDGEQKTSVDTGSGITTLIEFDESKPPVEDVNGNQKVSTSDTSVVSISPSVPMARFSMSHTAQLKEENSVIMQQPSEQTKHSTVDTDNRLLVDNISHSSASRSMGSSASRSMGSSATSSKSSLAFEDNFVTDAPTDVPPPLPPKVPLKRSQTVDTPTIIQSDASQRVTTAVVSVSHSNHPVPKPRNSIARQPAFYKQQRPPSFRKTSVDPQLATDAQTIKDARTAFIQSKTTKAVIQKRDDLDQFDPLVSGQLSVDTPRRDLGPHVDQEDNLLKEWNLDFETKLRGSSQPPPIPPKPLSPRGPVLSPFGSSPSGLNYLAGYRPGMVPAYPAMAYNQPRYAGGVYGPMVHPRSPHHRQQQHHTVQQLINQFSPGVNTQPPGGSAPRRPLSQVVMRNKTDLAQFSDRPNSMYVEGPQDPFADLLVISESKSPVRSAANSTFPISNSQLQNGRSAMTLPAGSVQDMNLHRTVSPGPMLQQPQSTQVTPGSNVQKQSWETFN